MATAPRQGLNAFIHGFLCGPKNFYCTCAGLLKPDLSYWPGPLLGLDGCLGFVSLSLSLSLSLSVRLLAVSELSAEGTADSDVAASCSSSPDAQDFESEGKDQSLARCEDVPIDIPRPRVWVAVGDSSALREV